MVLSHLALSHFRNYRSLSLDFQGELTLLQGPNAQGKTNLLEAVFFLATSKAVHAQTEKEVVDWLAGEEPIPYSRVAGRVRERIDSTERPLELEIVLTPRGDGVNFQKQVKINGVAKRSMDLVGLMRAVLFLPEDIILVAGGPAERRRYLDIALCQVDRAYCQALAAYQKVLAQRNSLLRTLREADAAPANPQVQAQLAFWDEKLVQHGSLVVARRHGFIQQLEQLARACHAELTGGGEVLQLTYLPSFNPGHLPDALFAQLRADRSAVSVPELPRHALTQATVAATFQAKLDSRRARELAAGASLYGPHRDDLGFLANGRDLRTYGSRGQQRTAALSLKLAEVAAMTAATGSAPILLLDDVMSELDAQRRSTLLAALAGVPQAIITTTDWEDFTPEFRARAQCMQVQAGQVFPR